jgi:hypothetical protein
LPAPPLNAVCPDGSIPKVQYAVVRDSCVVQVQCPPPPNGCGPGAPCAPNYGCSVPANGPTGCQVTCSCDRTGYLACTSLCEPQGLVDAAAPQPSACIPGEPCLGSCLVTASDPTQCPLACDCGSTGLLSCTACGGPLASYGWCVQWAPCAAGQTCTNYPSDGSLLGCNECRCNANGLFECTTACPTPK